MLRCRVESAIGELTAFSPGNPATRRESITPSGLYNRRQRSTTMERSESKTQVLGDAAQELLSYLRAHPDAQDTLEGIREWWARSARANSDVAEALDQLTNRGHITAQRSPDGARVYKL